MAPFMGIKIENNMGYAQGNRRESSIRNVELS